MSIHPIQAYAPVQKVTAAISVRRAGAVGNAAVSGSDSLDLSSTGRLLAEAAQVVQELPDVRPALVEAARARAAAPEADARDVAARMLAGLR